MGIAFIYVGVEHFLDPNWFKPIVPNIIGFPTFWVLLSGLCEVILGFLLILPKSRRLAALGLVLLLIVLYSANLNMWVNNIALDGIHLSHMWHTVRAVIQILLILIALWLGGFIPFGRLQKR
tara:strand:+ start:708 stop:1073 length:366 start_codon:yes stop_codon:yes gene_type:complete